MTKIPEKNYDPKGFEARIYREWEEGGCFHAEIDPAKEPYTIIMPPPNITGQLHMGHALDQTLQDVLIRFKRLQGYSALWLPGTDHASIATEMRVAEDILEKEGKTKQEIGREEFLKRAWAWRELYGGRITEQQRRLGTSCDWERERFTMDEGLNKAVVEQFVRLYEKGYIYKGSRMINWCSVCGTSLSDAEVEHEDREGMYWYFRYPSADGGEGIVVATSRPETMFGDTAVAVHPDDERYKDMIGKTVLLPIIGREIPVVADTYPDPDKGTGAVKITPAHDPNDFEVGERHGLEQIVCIGFDAKMTAESGAYEGMDRYDCRKAWVDELTEGGYLVKTEKVVIPVGTCYRCEAAVEPMVSEQWFVKMKELVEPAIAAAKDGSLKHVPERFEKIYLHWLEDIRDWCISRQLWWGHRIPAYYCDACGEIVVARERPSSCPACGAGELRQDEDVLDTWFSSALWPFSTLGWPEKTPDLDYFYPTSVLVTGYDIIFFWVVRMVFSGCEAMGEVPFRHVFVHGLVRAGDGVKMSKSLGNGVDPIEEIDRYGADALRFMLLSGSAAGNDMRFTTDKIEAARNFANKLWNASRFAIMNLGEGGAEAVPSLSDLPAGSLRDEDRWIIDKIAFAAADITRNIEAYDLSVATQKIYELIWNEYCDWYIEFVKPRLTRDDDADKQAARSVLIAALSDLLRLLHPFMPFITEEIWSFIGKDGRLIVDRWPVTAERAARRADAGPLLSADIHDTAEEAEAFARAYVRTETVKEIVRAVRAIRTEAGAAPSRALPIVIKLDKRLGREQLTDGGAPGGILSGIAELFSGASGASVRAELGAEVETLIGKLANVSGVTVTKSDRDVPADSLSSILTGMAVYVASDDLLDYGAERERLGKEKDRLEGNIARLRGKLANADFTSKAPENIVRTEREKLATEEDAYEKVLARLAAISGR
ncbi:MAG: valine--tRNA ligase [Clostridiales Family XIII bacterium]|jgi:valyl-tRNA synthetase|nr:valine--tRNA ligase [Clostridiales Family XIII bacterium]